MQCYVLLKEITKRSKGVEPYFLLDGINAGINNHRSCNGFPNVGDILQSASGHNANHEFVGLDFAIANHLFRRRPGCPAAGSAKMPVVRAISGIAARISSSGTVTGSPSD